MESGNGPATCQSHPSYASHALERDVFRPYPPGVMSGDDHLVGRGSRPTPASCCAQYAIVEYWQCDALGPQSEFTPLVDDGAALRWPDGGPRPRPMEEDRCHSTEA